MAHITGNDRSQRLLLPDVVDDYVGPDNPVRFIDAFVDSPDPAFRQVFRAFVRLCRDLDLYGCELIAVDGTRIKAVNHRGRNITQANLTRRIENVRGEFSLTALAYNLRRANNLVGIPAMIAAVAC